VLFQFSPELFSVALPCQSLLGPALVPWLQIERVLLDVLDNVFLLNFPLEPAESAFDRFTLLDLHFSHARTPPSRALLEMVVKRQTKDRINKVKQKTGSTNMLGYHE
jgi:hypothetical protein